MYKVKYQKKIEKNLLLAIIKNLKIWKFGCFVYIKYKLLVNLLLIKSKKILTYQ